MQAKRFKEGLKALKDMKGGKVKVKKKKKSDGVAAPADGTESLDSAMTSAVVEEGQEGAAGQAVEGVLPHEDSIESLDDEGEEIQQSIQKNLIQYRQLSQFQKIVLSLISGLCVSQEELRELQQAFIRLDRDNKGTLSMEDIKRIAESEFGRKY